MNTIQSLFAQKSWANNELFNLIATVDSTQHVEAIHAATRTLNHVYVVDCIFQAHLQGKQHGYDATNTEVTPDLGDLQLAAAETDAWFETYVSTTVGATLSEMVRFRFTDGDSGEMTREEMLLHVVTHGAYHRGNVGQVLKSISVAPPRDLYTKFLHLREPSRRKT